MRSHRPRILEAVFLLLIFLSGPVAHAGNWNEHVAHLNALSSKLSNGEHEIKELLEHKHATDDPEQVREIVREIADKHKELEEVSRDYEKERLHVRFQHPERADTEERKYERYKLKTLAEMENEIGMDGRLDRVKARVLATFPIPQPEKPKTPEGLKEDSHRHPASTNEEDEELPGRIHLVK